MFLNRPGCTYSVVGRVRCRDHAGAGGAACVVDSAMSLDEGALVDASLSKR